MRAVRSGHEQPAARAPAAPGRDLHQAEEGEWRAGSVLYFLVPDIAAAYAHLQRAAVTTSGAPHLVYTDPQGVQEWMGFFEDPDGNTLGVISRVAGP